MKEGPGRLKQSILGRRFGRLTAARDLGDDLFFCICDCGKFREVPRVKLVGNNIDTCEDCAARNRKNASKKRSRKVPELPEPPVKKPDCKGCYLQDGWLMVQPDCPRHTTTGQTGPGYARNPEHLIYAE